MKIKLQTLAFELLFFLLIVGFIQTASAYTTIESGDMIVIDYTIEDDVYAAGGNIMIEGVIIGDLVAAGGVIDIQGNVTQDVIVAGGDVSITGNVGDDVRIASGTLTINGNVEDDVISFSGDTVLSETGTIGGDLTSATGKLRLLGDIEGNITGSAGEVTLAGNVGENVDLNTGSLVVLPGAYIAGDLKYASPEKITVPSETVGKDVQYLKTEYEHHEDNRGFSVFSWIVGFVTLFVIGLVAMAIWPEQIQDIASRTPQYPGRSFIYGLGIFIVALIIMFLLMISIIGIPLSLLLLFLTLLILYTVKIITALWLGKYMFSRMDKHSKNWHELLLGLLVLQVLGIIPIIGALICMVATFIPLGNIYFASRK